MSVAQDGVIAGFQTVYVPPAEPGAPTLLLLHSTGGDERQLLGLGRDLAPSAGLLSPRGKVLEGGMPRFFARLAEGRFDLDEVRGKTDELADWLRAATAELGIAGDVIALGYSNGANVAVGLLQRHPGLLAGAVLLRAMLIDDAPAPADAPLADTPVLLLNGAHDPLVDAGIQAALAAWLTGAGADLSIVTQPAGHELTQPDFDAARDWIAERA